MEFNLKEIKEETITEAVKFAVSHKFNLDELSRLLVLEGGVDLDTLARIIRENRDIEAPSENDESGKTTVTNIEQPSQIQETVGEWFGLKAAS